MITRVVSTRAGRVSDRARLTRTAAAGRCHELGKTHRIRKEAEAWLVSVDHDLRTGAY
jgi:hypothetical protein